MLPDAVAEGRVPVVVFESTVYPGVTEDICAPILEAHLGPQMRARLLPWLQPRTDQSGRPRTYHRPITKVVSGQTPEVLDRVADLYGAITSGGVFRAASIKVAEAAKVIENAQRDINIAFMNEIAQIFEPDGHFTCGTCWRPPHQVELPAVHAGPCRRALHRGRSLLPVAPRRGAGP
jgi:UDP-N-acetyl-D-glucosamine/UDP-N-acetyl-D-galactosamine dehydrogenase